MYNTNQFKEITADVRDPNLKIITFAEAGNISFSNENGSSISAPPETTDEIRANAPNFFKAQNRLVTNVDFESYIKANYRNIIHDIKVVNNWEYLDGHMKYLYNIGLNSPSEDSRVLYNQVKFADSCNFNDIYIYVMPKVLTNNTLVRNNSYLNFASKQSIINSLNTVKMTSMEPIIMDPVYVGMGFGIKQLIRPDLDTVESILKQTRLVVRKSNNSYTNDNSIKQKVFNIIKEYFLSSNVKLGMFLNLDIISEKILNIPGVGGFFTARKTENEELFAESLSLVAFNPVYSQINEDVSIVNQNSSLPYYKVPFIFNEKMLSENILIAGVDYIDAGIREY